MPKKRIDVAQAQSRFAAFRADGPEIRRNLHGQIVHEIGQRIVRNDFGELGALPVEQKLAEEFGVSRPVLREAIKTLAAKGLIESRTRAGIRVRPRRYWNLLDIDVLSWVYKSTPTTEFLGDLLMIRQFIEPTAAGYAARMATEDDIAEIESAYQEMQCATDTEAQIAADLHFHGAVIAACRNDLLVHIGALIGVGLYISFQKWALSYKSTLPMHGKVLDAIRQRRPDEARQAMTDLLRVTEDLVDVPEATNS